MAESPLCAGQAVAISAIGAAATAVVAGIGAVGAAPGGNDAELFAIIAEEARLRVIGIDYRAQADKLFFALPIHERRRLAMSVADRDEGADYPAPMGDLYRLAVQYEDKADDLFDKVKAIQPTTIAGAIAGAIALLESLEGKVMPEIRNNVVAGLREIAGRAAQ
jgi:hypothetical protein